SDIEVDIKNFFAKKGYILEKRIYGKKAIFKISLGSLDGIKQGDQFEIIGKYENQNEITEESEVERRVIANGTITDKIDPKTSWVIIDDAKKIDSIRLGDSIKIQYKKARFVKIKRFFRSILN
ncbi:MAG: hypothetical protein KGQ36_07685, partial [Rickettsiales bacterium]|nr:hypothetical protein [Rickettsiales bacterium]